MPFRSEAQRRYMYSQHPQLAKEFEEATPENAHLPQHVKNMSDGGPVMDEPGLQDASVSDFLLPALGGKLAETAAMGAPEIFNGIRGLNSTLGESGELSLGRMAPKMEGAGEEGVDGITAYIKGIQKSPKGDIKIWGVKGDPEMLMKHFGDEAPGSVPEHILRQKGILPAETKSFPVNAPNSYAHGGEVNMATGGEMFSAGQQALQQLAAPLAPLGYPAQMAQGMAGSPIVQQAAGDIGASALGIPQSQPPVPPPPTQDQAFINQLNQGTAIQSPTQFSVRPQTPSLTQAYQTAQNAPSTNYDFYKNMSADDRAALYQKLTQQQHSGGNLAAEAVGGLGDAVSNAFGHGGQHTQQDIMNRAQASKEGQIGALDTQRQQKLQDVQARLTMMEADPNSAYSTGMRQFFTSNGIKVPSGMSAGMLKGLLPDMAKIFESRTTAATAAGAQGIEAGKALMGETIWDKVKEELGMTGASEGEQYLENRVSGASGAKPTNFTHTTPSGIKYGVH